MEYFISQIMLFLFGTLAVLLLTLNNRWSKWGPIIGVLAQPFFFYSAISDEAWGLFAVTFVYLFIYIYGIYNFWIKKETKGKK
jgi:hypothetical protein